MNRARVAMSEADTLIAQRQFGGALNRVYYGAFYAARALLALRRLDSSRHSGVIALFQQHFVKPDLISEEIARVLPQALTKRQLSDYGDFAETTADEVASLRTAADRFIGACEAILVGSSEP